VRYLEENHPGFLRRMFSIHGDPKAVDAYVAYIEREMIGELGMEPGSFWSEIDDVVISRFEEERR